MTGNKKIMTAILAIAMIAMAVPVMGVIGSDDSEAAGPAGQFTIYANDGAGWQYKINVEGYNALLALKNTTIYTGYTHNIDEVYDYQYPYGGELYWDINADYGTITTLMNKTNSGSNTWNVFVYTDTGSGFTWDIGIDAIGWYKPFNDYMDEYATANIALWYGDSSNASTMTTSLINYINSLRMQTIRSLTPVTITQGGVFEHLFNIRNNLSSLGYDPDVASGTTVTKYNPQTGVYTPNYTLTINDINVGVFIVGYGSDASTALANAINTGSADNVIFDNALDVPWPSYLGYSWMDSMFELITVEIVPLAEYNYWTLSEGYGSGIPLANFQIGAYSALTNAPLVQGTFSYIYDASVM